MRFEELYCATRLREGKVVRSTKGGKRFEERDLRFERADYQTAEFCYPLSAVRFPRERRPSDVRLEEEI